MEHHRFGIYIRPPWDLSPGPLYQGSLLTHLKAHTEQEPFFRGSAIVHLITRLPVVSLSLEMKKWLHG